MEDRTTKRGGWALSACALGLLTLATSSGCQSVYGGQLLPSPWYLTDDVQYFAPGPEFKLAREAAALKEARAEQASIPQ